MGNSIKQLTSSTEEEKGKLEMLSHELKVELEVQMEEKGMLALEVKKLRGALERRDQQEKQRKLLLMNEFREIDKLEKVVKRIIWMITSSWLYNSNLNQYYYFWLIIINIYEAYQPSESLLPYSII